MRTLWATALSALLVLASSSCESGDDCDPYSCDCGLASGSSSGGGQPASCVGAPLCNDDAECPAARQGEITPVCQGFGDLVLNGFSGQCILPCTGTGSCPGEMTCLGGQCRFVLELEDCPPALPCDGPGQPQQGAPIMIPADWVRIESECGFGFTGSPELVHEPLQGIDSCVDHWTTERCDYSADFGAFSDPLTDYGDSLDDYDESRAPIDGRPAILIQGHDGASFIAAANVGDATQGPSLTFWVTCSDAASRDEALTALRTIRFTDS